MHERVSEPKATGNGAASAAPGKRVAFYDLDGTLVDGNVITHYLFYALTSRSPVEKAKRIVSLVSKAPRYASLNRLDRRTFNEDFYRSFRGISEDRLVVLGDELCERTLRARTLSGARELIAADRANGYEPILITGALDVVARPIAKHLGLDRIYANQLVYDKEGIATGELRPPVLAGPGKATLVRRLAREEGIDLEQSRAYADDVADLPLLSSVGHAVCVNPDKHLRATAAAHRWTVLDLESPRDVGLFDRTVDRTLSILRLLEAAR